ncbi:MAG: thioesterase family protein [Pirellulaceae bacterium]|jgi:4-hydroxybenzoyl-CoA thioesterase/acyl-CoA thioester hydrolase|nr:thioesterase family protein [Pirellulaceae bacterium]HJN13552.1 thioesterase family protein [Pirellulaceae bacterium]
MATTFTTQRRVEFCETDAAGIAHFSAFFQYMEQAEHAMLRHVGLSVVQDDDEGTISWPRVAAKCEYSGPCRFEDVLDVSVSIAELQLSSVTYAFTFTLDGAEVAVGQMTAVCCRIEHDRPPLPIEIPSSMRDRLLPFAG